MKIKAFYKENGKNIIEFEDGSKMEYDKDYMTESDILFIELFHDIGNMKKEINDIKVKLKEKGV